MTDALPAALIVIDVQEGFDDLGYWGPTTNPDAERNVGRLVDAWAREARGPVVAVRHDSRNEGSPLHPSKDGNRLKHVVRAGSADLLVTKSVNSAFYGQPDLRTWLDASGIRDVVLCGIQTNMCVETTARMAGNLGYRVTVALDATRTFDLETGVPGAGSVSIPARDLMRATAVNLQGGGFATVSTTDEVLRG